MSRVIEEEKRTLEILIAKYCRDHHDSGELCPSCRELRDYAFKRVESCMHLPDKPTCSKCPTHCYKPEKRDEIRRVMRYSGPRILLSHPIVSIKHMIKVIKCIKIVS